MYNVFDGVTKFSPKMRKIPLFYANGLLTPLAKLLFEREG